MSDQNARIRLSVDTSQAQRDLRLIDKQVEELGGNKPIDLGVSGDSLQEFVDTQKKFIESLNGYISTTTSNTQKIISRLDQISKQADKATKRDADDIYRKKLQDLENQKKMLEAQLRQPAGSGSGGGTTPPASSARGASGTGTGGASPAGGEGNSTLSKIGGVISKISAVLVAGRAVTNYIGQGAQDERSLKSVAYSTFNRTGMYGSDFSKARANAHSLGVGYGYDARETMGFQGSLMSRAGYTTQENLKSDTNSLMAVSKAYGMNLDRVGYVAGKYSQTGVVQSGDQAKFANMLATSIKEVGMTGREDEQLDVLDQINDSLEKNLVNVTGSGVTNALGLYSTLAQGNSNLKGQRGADMVSTINEAITGGGTSIDTLLGWGTKYKGVEGRWALEEAKAKGISDPENLKTIVGNFESFTGQDINSASGKLMLMNQFGLTPEEVNELVSNSRAIKSGSYGESLSSALEGGTGAEDVNTKLQNYSDSEVATEEQYEINKKNAAAAVGDGINTATKGLKGLFNDISPGHQAMVGLGGAALQGWGAGKATQWAWNKATGAGKGATGAAGAAGGVDDAARAAAGSVDDAARAAAGSFDDVARAAAGGADDVVSGASKAASGLGKAGKALGIIGVIAEAIATGMDVKDALDKGDKREAAAQVGGGIGSVAGGIGGGILGGIAAGAATGALAGSVAPGVGNVIGLVIGGLGGLLGALGGNALGEAAGGAVYDATTGGADGSHATGNDYIPFDGYKAITHKGEAILTSHEAEQWRSGRSGNSGEAAAMEQQTRAFSEVTNINKDTVTKYASLIDEESDLLDKRERIYSKYSNNQTSIGSSGDSLSTLLGGENAQYNVGVTSNNLVESKKTGLLGKLASLFGFSSNSSSTGSSGGILSGSSGGSGGYSPVNKEISGDSLAAWTSNMIHGYEGNYDSINYNDNGAVSVGKIQWHGGRAKDLLSQIKNADPAGFNAIVQQYGAQALASSLASGDAWGSHVVSKGSAEASAIQALLGSEVGKQIQDSLMVSDVQSYIDKGKGLGLTDPKALAFYSDLVNQYGMYSDTINKVIVPQAVANGGSLSSLYQAAIANLSKYHDRRTNVYDQLNGADLSQFQDKAVGIDRVPYDGYKVRAHKDETLLSANDSKDYREKKGILSSLINPLEQLNSKGSFPQQSEQATQSPQSFNGELKIILGGSVEGMTSENQTQLVTAVIQRLSSMGGYSVLNNLNNSLVRVSR